MPGLIRRDVLALLAAMGIAKPTLAHDAQPAHELDLGPAEPFSFEQLKGRAQALAATPYSPPPAPSPQILDAIDYDAHGKIRFKTEYALWAPRNTTAGEGEPIYPVTLFHLGRYFMKPQKIYMVSENAPGRTEAREVRYRREYFSIPADSPAMKLEENIGFAGFRFQESAKGSKGWHNQTLDWRSNDWVAFLGASYFRAIGDQWQYGASARGVFVDPAIPERPEEFPDFTHVWLEQKAPNEGEAAPPVTVYALLDGPSITGAYRFIIKRENGVTMDIEKHLFIRRDIRRLGIAPITSMYWYSETVKPAAIDWRPEIHDSDGLAMFTGGGERIWRALNNPPYVIVSSFSDFDPKGFGLIQRDREFDHYSDGVNYHRRPSVWVEPQGKWGHGAVQLLEIPTDDEIHDNIVAAWVPEQPATAGSTFSFSYRLFWRSLDPEGTGACVLATRIGRGGQPGRPRPNGIRKFTVEFQGGRLPQLAYGEKPEPVITASRGRIVDAFCEPVPSDIPGHWRAIFDLEASGKEPVELRGYLRHKGDALSETWLYQYHPI